MSAFDSNAGIADGDTSYCVPSRIGLLLLPLYGAQKVPDRLFGQIAAGESSHGARVCWIGRASGKLRAAREAICVDEPTTLIFIVDTMI